MIKKRTVNMAERKEAADKRKAFKKGLIAVGTLAAAGVAAAVMLDPKAKEKKEEIIENLKEGFQDLKEDIRHGADHLSEKIEEIKEES